MPHSYFYSLSLAPSLYVAIAAFSDSFTRVSESHVVLVVFVVKILHPSPKFDSFSRVHVLCTIFTKQIVNKFTIWSFPDWNFAIKTNSLTHYVLTLVLTLCCCWDGDIVTVWGLFNFHFVHNHSSFVNRMRNMLTLIDLKTYVIWPKIIYYKNA